MTHGSKETQGIGSRLRAARERLAWSREALAFHSGISWPAIAQVESGRRTNVRPSTLAALAAPLGVTIDYLVNGRPSQVPMLRHSAFRYSTNDQFRAIMAPFLADGVERSEATLALTTKRNIDLLRKALGKDSRQVRFVESRQWLTTPDAALAELRSFCDAKLKRGVPWLRFIAEPIWKGRSEADIKLWTRFESLLNVLFRDFPLTLVCPYDERSVPPEILERVELTHPEILGTAGSSKSSAYRAYI
jgi:transcriptional regulator with XRE-family HTH domain